MLTLIFKIYEIRFCFYLKQLKAIAKLARTIQGINIEMSVVKLVNAKLEKNKWLSYREIRWKLITGREGLSSSLLKFCRAGNKRLVIKFYEKLTVSVEALETLRKFKNSNGYERDAFYRIAGIRADLVRLGWQLARLGVWWVSRGTEKIEEEYS